MVLNFGGLEMFPKAGLYNDDGLLKSRWAQDGSDLINLQFNNNTSRSVYTVTAGKVLYISALINIHTDNQAAKQFVLLDNGAGGTTKVIVDLQGIAGAPISINFNPPLKFETDIYNTESAAAVFAETTLTGWEEDA